MFIYVIKEAFGTMVRNVVRTPCPIQQPIKKTISAHIHDVNTAAIFKHFYRVFNDFIQLHSICFPQFNKNSYLRSSYTMCRKIGRASCRERV